jgi:hypothetical protein
VHTTNGAAVRVTFTPSGKRGDAILFEWDGGRAEYDAGDVSRPTGPTSGMWLNFGAGVAIGAAALEDVWACCALDEPPAERAEADTQADTIAARYGNDGREWIDANGVELEECLVSLGARCEWRDGHGTDVRRYTLADGSAILLAGDCWDVGYADCWCSATGIAHESGCVAGAV